MQCFGWRCAKSHMPVWRYIFRAGVDYNWKHISDTHTMRWEMQSGRRLFLDTLRELQQQIQTGLQRRISDSVHPNKLQQCRVKTFV